MSETACVSRPQRTLREKAYFSGLGVHTGMQVMLSFFPAEEGTGIIFKRVDLAGSPEIPARIDCVSDTQRSTTIGVKGVRIQTVEHVLAALKAYQIDNLIIEISNLEPPIGDGSSAPFIDMIESSGVVEQKALIPVVKLQRPIYWSDKDIHIVAIPYSGFRVSYTLSYPSSKVLKAQFYSSEVTPELFKREIGVCRTFSLYEEIEHLIDRGLIKGGSLDNSIVLKEDVVFSREGLRFPDEMVRHKVLDLIGDISLTGIDFHAHIMAIRSGHQANFAFAKILFHILNEEIS